MDGDIRNVTLDDKYEIEKGSIFVNGTQALSRLLILQRQRDLLKGLNTAGFVSGYRGSPIGGLDMTLWGIKERLQKNHITFQPGLNEELAATAVAGSQQLSELPDSLYDGVFALWYGKGPGVDRAMDALKHGNFAGTHPNGGVLLAYGDDHPGKSSTVAHQSEQALAAQLIPSLYPASVGEYFEYGLLAWALSRYSGAWIGMKCVNETIEQTATCDVDVLNDSIVIPEIAPQEPGANYHGSLRSRIENEQIALERRLPRVHQFIFANRLDRRVFGAQGARFGIVTAGKSYHDVMRALSFLGIDSEKANQVGIAVYKVGCIWPLEPEGLSQFADGLDEILVVEEKKSFLEAQIATLIVNRSQRIALSGKSDPTGAPLLSPSGQLEPFGVAAAIAQRLQALGAADDAILERAAQLEKAKESNPPAPAPAIRMPFFCSGCPHNRSTKIPKDSRAMVGTGCATMEVFFRPDRIVPTQMGGEGANWIGLAPYTRTDHIFQNMGDGTYYHSGLLSVRAAIAAKVNITFKLLYNDAVAMTGGQPVDGPLSVGDITYQVLHEGVARCVVVTDDVDKYDSGSGLAPGVSLYHRDGLDAVQKELRDIPGCTFLIYEQTCAAEKRRRRKKGKFPNPKKRLYINEAVCEGCGDCSAKANCVSILPVETALGRKRKIDQFNCNKDYSCALGFCPSFVTVYDAEPRKPDAVSIDASTLHQLPPPICEVSSESFNVMFAGIGGTGVVTAAAVLGMAAHLEGRASSVFDMTGLAQKNGAVYSHLKVAKKPEHIQGAGIAGGNADLVLGFDLIAATSGDSVATFNNKHTRLVANAAVSPTASFQLDRDANVPKAEILTLVGKTISDNNVDMIDAKTLAELFCGDILGANFILIGYAFQKGLLPVSLEALERAITLNGVAVEFNRHALSVGRLAAHNPKWIEQALEAHHTKDVSFPETLNEIIEHRAAHLAAYQGAAYAEKYRNAVSRARQAETEKTPNCEGLAEAVAKNYAKLLAYKDEYEVARLYSDPQFLAGIREQFEGDPKLKFNLAPPILSRPDPKTGEAKKIEFGSWILNAFRLLALMRRIRGTPFDIFGYNEERRMERRLISDYEQRIEETLSVLTPSNHAAAVALLSLPEGIRGFGPVKERSVKETEQRAEQYLSELRAG